MRMVKEMRSAMFGMLAIPLIFALVCLPGSAQACNGGGGNLHDERFLDATVNVGPGSYNATEFSIPHDVSNVQVMGSNGAKVLILADSEIVNFTNGQNYTAVYDTQHGHYIQNISAGWYWAIVDNRAQTTSVKTDVRIGIYAPKENCVYDPNPFPPVPDVSSGLVALAMVMAAVMTVVVRKR